MNPNIVPPPDSGNPASDKADTWIDGLVSRPQSAGELDTRHCAMCAQQLVKRFSEPLRDYRVRRFCNRSCAQCWKEEQKRQTRACAPARPLILLREKTCTKCGTLKPVSEYYAHASSSDGKRPDCKLCSSNRMKAWRSNNASHLKEYEAKRYATPERKARTLDSHRRARINNPEKLRAEAKLYRERHPERAAASVARWFSKNPLAKKAHDAVRYAVKSGSIVREPCESCGAKRAVAHHDDYTKPLVVRWLCQRCHMRWHQHNAAIGGDHDMA